MSNSGFSKLITSENPGLMNAGSRNGVRIDRIVIHHNATTNKNVAMNTWLVSSGNYTSAHYEVTPTEIIGCVEERYAAYHCGGTGGYDIPKMANPNQRSIGIENLNSTGAPSWKIAEGTYKNLARLVKDICKRYNIPCDRKHVLEHREVTSTACPGGIDVNRVVRMANGLGTAIALKKRPKVKNVDVYYGLHQLGGSWLSEVKNFRHVGSNGYAGYPNHKHDLLYAHVSRGTLKARVHTIKGGWLPWKTFNSKSTKSDCIGKKGYAIDGVQFEYWQPKGERSQQAYYRSQTTQRAGWLDSVRDTHDYAGIYGEPLDRLQLNIDNYDAY